MALYESEHTLFMRDLLAKHPEWLADQREGRAIWWDRKIDPVEQSRAHESAEVQKPYPYDVNYPVRGE